MVLSGCRWIGLGATVSVSLVWLASFFCQTVIAVTIDPREKESRIVAEVGRKTFEDGLIRPGHFILEHPQTIRYLIQSGSGWIDIQRGSLDYLASPWSSGITIDTFRLEGIFHARSLIVEDDMESFFSLPYWISLAILLPLTVAAFVISRFLNTPEAALTPSAASSPAP